MSSSARAASDRRSSTVPKRTSLLPKPSSIAIDPSVLIAQHAQLTGMYPITVGPDTVLHPHSRINSAFCPVLVGEGVILYEKSKIGFGSDGESAADSRRSSMAPVSVRDSMRAEGTVLGSNVVVESNAVVEAAEVGEGTVIEVGAVLGRGCVVGKVCLNRCVLLCFVKDDTDVRQFCTISAYSFVPPHSHLPDYTVVYGGSEQRIDKTLQLRPEIAEAKMAIHRKQLDMFKKLVPNQIAKWM
jgi:dynactin-6